MEQSRTIDRSFKDRLGVLQLLERLKKENITYAEMDDIGNQLRKAGRSAVQPLLRKLWREKNGTLISKYTYLLDFLDDRYWFDQIIQIALHRKDLELEGKSAILATLEDCGVDVTVPPFSVLLSCSPGPIAETFPLLMDKGDEGVLWLLEDFACLPMEAKFRFLRELSRLGDPRVLEFLELLLWHDEPEVAEEVVAAVGRIRQPRAVALLEDFRRGAPDGLQAKIDHSLRRLSFVGITAEAAPAPVPRPPFHSAYAGPLDGSGYRHLWLARWRADGRIDSVDFQLHDLTGIKCVWGE
ncbi:MAG TPA: HEAT repeat domain-containing protein, partial [Geobacteraceae bacterium]|nr:HEAT repeat domain-containing protein [Geobacteraceae bacterium]